VGAIAPWATRQSAVDLAKTTVDSLAVADSNPLTNQQTMTPQQTRILDAARRLFLTHGYNAAKLRDIAKAADVSMGGIYHHFESKQQIYEALYKQTDVASDLFQIMLLFQASDFPENLGAIGDAIARTIRKHRDTFKLFYIDVLEFKGANVKPVIQAFRTQFNGLAEKLLARRKDELAHIHPAILMRVMVDLFLHTHLEEAMLETTGNEGLGLTSEEVTRQMAQVILYGVMKRP
jgi:AcrR family transcriptional regulator